MSHDEHSQDPNDPEEDQDWASTLRGVSDSLRKTIGSGIRSVLSSDEGIRRMIKDSIPREVLGYAMKQVDSAKDEVVRMVGNQTRKFLENLDLGHELQKVLTSVSLEFRTELRFIPNDKAVRPEGKVQVKVKGRETEVESKPVFLNVGLVKDTVASAIQVIASALGKETPSETPPETETASESDEDA